MNFPLASVGSQAGGDNRKRVRSAQRRVGPELGRRPCARVASIIKLKGD